MPTKNPYSFKAKIIQRAKGKSAVAAAAYQAGEKLTDQRTGRRSDYSRKKGVLHTEILTPPNSPSWAMERRTLWNAVEEVENRKDAQVARRFILALPCQLTDEQRKDYARGYCLEQFVSKGIICDFAIHAPESQKNQDNYHAHILLSMRDIGQEGFGKKNRDWNKVSLLETWREQWAVHTNRALLAAGFEPTWDHRTLEEQGIDRVPQVHLGQAVIEMEQRGIKTDRGERALQIARANSQLEELKLLEKEIQDEQRLGKNSESPQLTLPNRVPRATTTSSQSENRTDGKGGGEHAQGPEKAPPAAPRPAAKPTRPAFPRPVIKEEGFATLKGGQDMQQQENLARAFQAGIESRRRQREWEEQRFALLQTPAAGLTYAQAERRRELIERWDWLRYEDDVRRRAAEDLPQGLTALRQIEERQRQAREAARRADAQTREIQERLEEVKPFQIFQKSRLVGELQAAEKALAQAEIEQKRLAVAEKKLLASCPDSVVERYRWRKEEERARAVANLLHTEMGEDDDQRRREEEELDRLRSRPVAIKTQKPGGWSPPSPG